MNSHNEMLPPGSIKMDGDGLTVSKNTVEWALQNTFSFAKLMSYYKCAMMEVETKFNVLNEEFSLQYDRQPISAIKTRLKNPLSIRNKLMVRGLPMTVKSIEENLHDVAGIRVVCSFKDDVYMLADALLRQDDISLITEKDYIKIPKPNGYRSLHLIVEVPIFLQDEKKIMQTEIQLRTIAMDSWASMEHQLNYKKNNNLTEDMLGEIQRCASLSAELDDQMNSICRKVYGDYDEYDNIIQALSRMMTK